jgi:probable H4MPT-linked C1 transfer pathway protein
VKWLALDVGGANLKAAHGDGRAWSMGFALWRQPQYLAAKLADLTATAEPFDAVAVTMTAELCDCYASKREGVLHVLDAVRALAAGRPVRVWTLDGSLVGVPEAEGNVLRCAASNWLALAVWLAGRFAVGRTLLIDCGSTTTDIVPLEDGRARPRGLTDTNRLAEGELIYVGVRRTPLCALGTSIMFQGRSTRVMAEQFATTGDALLIRGELPTEPDRHDTADGRPWSREAAAARIVRMVGADLEVVGAPAAQELADAFADLVQQRVCEAIDQVCRVFRPARVVLSGSGEFLAARAAGRSLPNVEQVRLEQLIGGQASQAACAYALAQLATGPSSQVPANTTTYDRSSPGTQHICSTSEGDPSLQRSLTQVSNLNGAPPELQDQDLIGVVNAWPTLSPAIKAGILAMIEAQRGLKDSAP